MLSVVSLQVAFILCSYDCQLKSDVGSANCSTSVDYVTDFPAAERQQSNSAMNLQSPRVQFLQRPILRGFSISSTLWDSFKGIWAIQAAIYGPFILLVSIENGMPMRRKSNDNYNEIFNGN